MSNIVVTGMGIVTGLGLGKSATLEGLLGYKTGVENIRYLQTRHNNILASEVKLSEDEMRAYLHIPENQKTTRNPLLGMLAVKEAIEQARVNEVADKQIAFINGTTVGGIDKVEQLYHEINAGNELEYIDLYACGSGTDAIADFIGCCNMTMTVSTACSSAANAIIQGANLLKTGRCNIAIVGGMESLSKFHLNGFNTLMILDKEQCKPFDRDRAGLNLGEGAGYLVLETEESAKQRGIEILCKLSGYANTCDAYHQTASSPDGEGAFLAMKNALAAAKLMPSDIDYINAHGTGTESNDSSESCAIARVFGDKIPPVSSTKAFTGHTTSAAGGVESVISILALQNNFIPANLNFKNKIENTKFAPVSQNINNQQLQHVMTNSFGFGGNDSSCIFSKIK